MTAFPSAEPRSPQGGHHQLGTRRSASLVRTEQATTSSGHRADPDRRSPLSMGARLLLSVVLAVAGLAALVVWTQQRVESQLVERTEARLLELGLDPTAFDIDFDATVGRVSGPLPDGWTAARFVAAITVDGAGDIELDLNAQG